LAENRNIWYLAGLALMLFLVVTTPGWKEVLGVNIDFGKYGPAIVLLAIMGGLLAIVLGGEGGKEGG